MILSHKIELDTTYKQRNYFARCCGTARFVWNRALAAWNDQYAAGEKPSGMALKRVFNEDKYELFPWMKDIHRDCHSQPFANLQKAFVAFFKGTANRPKFKCKGKCRDSFYLANDTFRVDGEVVVLPKIGRVRLKEALRFVGKIMGAVVSRTADSWFISIQVEVGDFRKPRTGDDAVGVDLGITTTVTVSNGQEFAGPRSLKANLEKLRRLSRQHSRKQKGSNNRRKSAMRLARLHARIANIRQDFHHKTTTKLARENQAVYFEDLAVGNMLKNRKLARAISDAGWHEVRRMAEYKARIYGGVFAKISRWFPSSKKCRVCGETKATLKLSERTFRCESCGHTEGRDLNAAHNIRTAGLAGIACGPGSSGSAHQGRSETIPG